MAGCGHVRLAFVGYPIVCNLFVRFVAPLGRAYVPVIFGVSCYPRTREIVVGAPGYRLALFRAALTL